MVWEQGWLFSYPVGLSDLHGLWLQGGEETASADPVLGWIEAGEIHVYFVHLHVFHFNFLDGGQALQKFIEVYTISRKY